MGPYLGISLLKAISAKGMEWNGYILSSYILVLSNWWQINHIAEKWCWSTFQSNPSWEEGRVKIRQRQRWEQNQDFPTTPSFPLSLSPYLGADGDEHGHLFYNCFFTFCFGIKVSRVSGSGFAKVLYNRSKLSQNHGTPSRKHSLYRYKSLPKN